MIVAFLKCYVPHFQTVVCEDKRICYITRDIVEVCRVFLCPSDTDFPCHLDKCEQSIQYDIMCDQVLCTPPPPPTPGGHTGLLAAGISVACLLLLAAVASVAICCWRKRQHHFQAFVPDNGQDERNSAVDEETLRALPRGPGEVGAEQELQQIPAGEFEDQPEDGDGLNDIYLFMEEQQEEMSSISNSAAAAVETSSESYKQFYFKRIRNAMKRT
jgi:hypothetical protein